MNIQNKTGNTKSIRFTPDMMEFLEFLTRPADLDYKACQADFIRNEVLRDLRRKIWVVEGRGCYNAK